jgi:hypothetical protein
MDGDTDTPAVPVPPITAPAPALLDAPDAANPPSILLDTVLLLLLRVLFFYLARRYLLAQLNPALRELQKPDVTLPTHHIQRARNRDRANSRASVVSFRSTHSGRSVASSIAGSSAPRALPVQGGVGRAPSVHSTPSVSPAPLPSDVDDTDDIDDTDEPSSYPASEDGTPRIKTIHITRGDATPPLEGPAAGGEAIGMGLLGAKLRDTSGGGRPQVLELSHARTETAGSRAGKRTARGLGRVAR